MHPSEKIIKYRSGIQAVINVGWNSAPVKSITNIRAIKEKPKLIRLEATVASGNRYFGIYTFFINEAFHKIELRPLFVASELQLKTTFPIMT